MKVGAGVSTFVPGDPVVGLCDRLGRPTKAQAEYIVLDRDAVGHLSAETNLIAAATLPLNSLTARACTGAWPTRCHSTASPTPTGGWTRVDCGAGSCCCQSREPL